MLPQVGVIKTLIEPIVDIVHTQTHHLENIGRQQFPVILRTRISSAMTYRT